MKYKHYVDQIKNLQWGSLSPAELQQVMVLSAYAATEFAESLRIALTLFPDDANFKEMARGELTTDNLHFEDYCEQGDHKDFLWYFINKYKIESTVPIRVIETGEAYLNAVRSLDNKVRAMSIVSREQELPAIFKNILEAPDWDAVGLNAFNYYLRRHVNLDSQKGGHAELLSAHKVTDNVATFYKARLEMYRAIPKFFE